MDQQKNRQEIEADWEARLTALRRTYAKAFCEACARRGMKACALPVAGSDAVPLPVFGDASLEIPRHRLLEIIKASPHPEYAEQQVDLLERILTDNLLENPEQFVVEGADLERVETMRRMLLREINRNLKALHSHRKSLEGLLTPLTPVALTASLRSGLSYLELAEVFATQYRDFLEEQDPKKQDPKKPSPFNSKGKRTKRLADEWKSVMTALVRFFGDGESHLSACKRAAEVLAAVFPCTWGARPIEKLVHIIRNRTTL
ncbi:MAG: hypothetical protein BA869_01485 [Desulfuromonadales bacterium C00003107]|jgi:hypothetical protein|nr:MAG: hypothetical protein BA869_01485 [Desulfuromonadales bacterium C00003107]